MSKINTPNFLIIGSAKSGTTTIYQYLSLHPNIYLSTQKEPDFFSRDENFYKGINYYYSLFRDASPQQICGEASTTYSRLHLYPKTVSRIAQFFPQMKFIFIMRHPIDRAYSFYVHRFKGSLINPEKAMARNEFMSATTFEEAIKQTPEFLDSSMYFYQIQEYLDFYPKESFLFLLMEDLIATPEKTLKQICDFLKIEYCDSLINQKPIVANQRDDFPLWYQKKQALSSFKKNFLFQHILSLIPQNFKNQGFSLWKFLFYRSLQKENMKKLPPPMTNETRKMLLKQFYYPNQQLSEFLGVDLSHWNQ